MVRLILFILRLIFVVFQQLLIGLWYALPFIFGLLFFTAGASLKLTAVAGITAFRGLPETADVLSDEWTRRAIEAGFPNLWQRHLKSFFYAIAVFTIIAGWLLILFTLAFIVGLMVWMQK